MLNSILDRAAYYGLRNHTPLFNRVELLKLIVTTAATGVTGSMKSMNPQDLIVRAEVRFPRTNEILTFNIPGNYARDWGVLNDWNEVPPVDMVDAFVTYDRETIKLVVRTQKVYEEISVQNSQIDDLGWPSSPAGATFTAVSEPMPIDSPNKTWIQIGYATFCNPVMLIEQERTTNMIESSAIRQAGSLRRNVGKAYETYSMSWIANGPDEIKSSVQDIIEQVSLTPFLPVRGGPFHPPLPPATPDLGMYGAAPLISNATDEIPYEAIAVRSISVATMDGMPNSLLVTLQFDPFAWNWYLPITPPKDGGREGFDDPDKDSNRFELAAAKYRFSDYWCMPLFKLWCKTRTRSAYKPSAFTGKFELSYPSEEALDVIHEIEETRRFASVNPNLNVIQGLRELLEEKNYASTRYAKEIKTTAQEQRVFIFRAFDRFGWEQMLKHLRPFIAGVGDILIFDTYTAYEPNGTLSQSKTRIYDTDAETQIAVPAFEGTIPESRLEEFLRSKTYATYTYTSEASAIFEHRLKEKVESPWNHVAIYVRVPFSRTQEYGVILRKLSELFERTEPMTNLRDALSTKILRNNEVTIPDDQNAARIERGELVFSIGPNQMRTDVIIERISGTRVNRVTTLSRQRDPLPIHQYLGSLDASFTVEGTCFGLEAKRAIEDIKNEFDKRAVLKASHKFTTEGLERNPNTESKPLYLMVDNEIFNLLGTYFVIPVSVHFTNEEGFPNVWKFTITFVEMDPTLKSSERMKPLRTGVEGTIFKYGGTVDFATENPTVKRAMEWRGLQNRLGEEEVYPDMRLPTYGDVNLWITLCKKAAQFWLENKTALMALVEKGVTPLDAIMMILQEKKAAQLLPREELFTPIELKLLPHIVGYLYGAADQMVRWRPKFGFDDETRKVFETYRFVDPDFYCCYERSETWNYIFDEVVREAMGIDPKTGKQVKRLPGDPVMVYREINEFEKTTLADEGVLQQPESVEDLKSMQRRILKQAQEKYPTLTEAKVQAINDYVQKTKGWWVSDVDWLSTVYRSDLAKSVVTLPMSYQRNLYEPENFDKLPGAVVPSHLGDEGIRRALGETGLSIGEKIRFTRELCSRPAPSFPIQTTLNPPDMFRDATYHRWYNRSALTSNQVVTERNPHEWDTSKFVNGKPASYDWVDACNVLDVFRRATLKSRARKKGLDRYWPLGISLDYSPSLAHTWVIFDANLLEDPHVMRAFFLRRDNFGSERGSELGYGFAKLDGDMQEYFEVKLDRDKVRVRDANEGVPWYTRNPGTVEVWLRRVLAVTPVSKPLLDFFFGPLESKPGENSFFNFDILFWSPIRLLSGDYPGKPSNPNQPPPGQLERLTDKQIERWLQPVVIMNELCGVYNLLLKKYDPSVALLLIHLMYTPDGRPFRKDPRRPDLKEDVWKKIDEYQAKWAHLSTAPAAKAIALQNLVDSFGPDVSAAMTSYLEGYIELSRLYGVYRPAWRRTGEIFFTPANPLIYISGPGEIGDNPVAAIATNPGGYGISRIMGVGVGDIAEEDTNLRGDISVPAVLRAQLRGSYDIKKSSMTDAQTITRKYTAAMDPHDEANLIGMYLDFRRYNCVGRLLAAFPAYQLVIINEGFYWNGGNKRLWDTHYTRTGVSSIEVFKSRHTPTETCTITLSNMFHSLTAYAQMEVLIHNMALSNYRKVVRDISQQKGNGFLKAAMNFASVIWAEAVVKSVPEDAIKFWYNHQLKQLVMGVGARIHLRMGYGSFAPNLPVVFNGNVVEAPNSEGVVTLVATSDGAELEKPLTGKKLVRTEGTFAYETTGLLDIGKDPSAIVTESMVVAGLGDLIFEGNYRNMAGGLFHYGDIYFQNMAYSTAELQINIYSSAQNRMEQGLSSIRNYYNFNALYNADDVTLFGVQVKEPNVWRVAEVCRRAVTNFVADSLPFGTRSTLFFGRWWYPYHYEFSEKIDKIGTYRHGFGMVMRPSKQIKPLERSKIFLENTRIVNVPYDDLKPGEMPMATGSWPKKLRFELLTMVAAGIIESVGPDTIVRAYNFPRKGTNPLARNAEWSIVVILRRANSAGYVGVIYTTEKITLTAPGGFESYGGPPAVPTTVDEESVKVLTDTELLDFMDRYGLGDIQKNIQKQRFIDDPEIDYAPRVDKEDIVSADIVRDVYMLTQYMRWKPYMQAFVVDSDINLLANDIVADGSKVYTDAYGIYTYNYALNLTSVMKTLLYSIDTDIMPSSRKTLAVDTGIYISNLQLGFDALKMLGAKVMDFVPSAGEFIREGVTTPALQNAVVGALLDTVKDMYQGWITIYGSPWIRPRNFFYFKDETLDMDGPLMVKEVVHRLDGDLGMVTMISPDAVVLPQDSVLGQNIITTLSIGGLPRVAQIWVTQQLAAAAMAAWLVTKRNTRIATAHRYMKTMEALEMMATRPGLAMPATLNRPKLGEVDYASMRAYLNETIQRLEAIEEANRSEAQTKALDDLRAFREFLENKWVEFATPPQEGAPPIPDDAVRAMMDDYIKAILKGERFNIAAQGQEARNIEVPFLIDWLRIPVTDLAQTQEKLATKMSEIRKDVAALYGFLDANGIVNVPPEMLDEFNLLVWERMQSFMKTSPEIQDFARMIVARFSEAMVLNWDTIVLLAKENPDIFLDRLIVLLRSEAFADPADMERLEELFKYLLPTMEEIHPGFFGEVFRFAPNQKEAVPIRNMLEWMVTGGYYERLRNYPMFRSSWSAFLDRLTNAYRQIFKGTFKTLRYLPGSMWRVGKAFFGVEARPSNYLQLVGTARQAYADLDDFLKAIAQEQGVETIDRARLTEEQLARLRELQDAVRQAERELGAAQAGHIKSRVMRAVRNGILPEIQKALKSAKENVLLGRALGVKRLFYDAALLGIGTGLVDALTNVLRARESAKIFPLRVGKVPYVAGITGHQGAVAGDDPSYLDQFFRGKLAGILAPIIEGASLAASIFMPLGVFEFAPEYTDSFVDEAWKSRFREAYNDLRVEEGDLKPDAE